MSSERKPILFLRKTYSEIFQKCLQSDFFFCMLCDWKRIINSGVKYMYLQRWKCTLNGAWLCYTVGWYSRAHIGFCQPIIFPHRRMHNSQAFIESTVLLAWGRSGTDRSLSRYQSCFLTRYLNGLRRRRNLVSCTSTASIQTPAASSSTRLATRMSCATQRSWWVYTLWFKKKKERNCLLYCHSELEKLLSCIRGVTYMVHFPFQLF